MINTYNETSLHRTLKHLYSLENDGSQEEVPVGDFIADIVTQDGSIIEIQTGSLSHLYKKLVYFIAEKRNVTVVYPLVTEKIIETKTADGKIRKRKSPAKKNLYSVFRELTGLYTLILSRYFTLEVLEVKITEERIQSEDLQQSMNNRRRFRKNWNKSGKRLEEIADKKIFHGKKSWKKLLPDSLKEDFTVKELYSLLKPSTSYLTLNQIQLMVWVYCHAGLIHQTGKKGKAYTYSVK